MKEEARTFRCGPYLYNQNTVYQFFNKHQIYILLIPCSKITIFRYFADTNMVVLLQIKFEEYEDENNPCNFNGNCGFGFGCRNRF